MRIKISLFYQIFMTFSLAILLSTPSRADSNGADSPQKLTEMIQSAYASKDKNAFKMLYLPRGDKQQINATVEVMGFDKSIKSVEWSPSNKMNQPADSYTGPDGVVHAYCPGPAGGGSITVNYSDDEGHKVIPAVFLYGQENGRFYLVTTCS